MNRIENEKKQQGPLLFGKIPLNGTVDERYTGTYKDGKKVK